MRKRLRVGLIAAAAIASITLVAAGVWADNVGGWGAANRRWSQAATGHSDEGCGHEAGRDDECFSVHISGRDMKSSTISEIGALWGIGGNELLEAVEQEFGLTRPYTVDDVLDSLRDEYRFSPAQVKALAEDLARNQ